MSVISLSPVLTLTITTLLSLNLLLILKYRNMQKRHQRRLSADQQSRFRANCEKYSISVREVDVLRLILAGGTYKAVADTLFISEKTVDAHLRSIYAKSGVRNKVELVVKFHD